MLAISDSIKRQIGTNGLNGFELWYQPVYRVPTGIVVHNEVLLRWRDENGHLYYPQYFMPLVAQAKQQQCVDRLVIQKTVQALVGKPEMTLAVNLSDQVLSDFYLLDDIHNSLQTYNINAHQLNFEISEIAIAQHFNDAITFVQKLKELGCAVILDDFANRYLSFIQWEKLNVDAVKVDSHLLQGLEKNLQNSSLVESIVAVSDQLGLTSIAKFFDSSSNSSIVERFQFDAVQGFHRNPPSRHPRLARNVNLFGVSIDNLSQQEFLSQLQSGVVFSPDVDHLIHFRKNQQLRQAYTIADYKICNSNIFVVISKLLGFPIKKISDSDFFLSFCQYHQDNLAITMFLLGGTENSLTKAQANINKTVGRTMVVDTYSPLAGFEKREQDCHHIVERINRSGATVLVVGTGAPNPELWIYQYRAQLPGVKIIFTIGHISDIEAKNTRPVLNRLRDVGKWLHRALAPSTQASS